MADHTDEDWMDAADEVPRKIPVSIRLDEDVLAFFRASGRGYQTRINAVLRRFVVARSKGGRVDRKAGD